MNNRSIGPDPTWGFPLESAVGEQDPRVDLPFEEEVPALQADAEALELGARVESRAEVLDALGGAADASAHAAEEHLAGADDVPHAGLRNARDALSGCSHPRPTACAPLTTPLAAALPALSAAPPTLNVSQVSSSMAAAASPLARLLPPPRMSPAHALVR
jgi:hypothetical protein